MRPAPFRTILMQDVRMARAWLADAAREPWLLIGLPVMAVAGGVLLFQGVRRMAGLSLAETSALGLAIGLAGGFMLVRAFRRQASADLLGGVFGYLLADPQVRRRVVLGRAILAGIIPALLLAALVAALWPSVTATLFSGVLFLSALPGGAAAMLLPEARPGAGSTGKGVRAPFGWPPLAWRLSSGRAGLVAAVPCAGLAVAVALSGLSQTSIALVQGAVFFGALAAGLCLLPGDGILPRLLGAGRAPLWRLTLAASAVPMLAALTAGTTIALTDVSANTAAMALAAAACVAALAALRLFVDLNGGTRSSPLRFGIELALIALAAAVLAPLAAVWTGFRLVLLGRQASRRRWSLT